MKEPKVNEIEKVSEEIVPVVSDFMGGFYKGLIAVGALVGVTAVLFWLWS